MKKCNRVKKSLEYYKLNFWCDRFLITVSTVLLVSGMGCEDTTSFLIDTESGDTSGYIGDGTDSSKTDAEETDNKTDTETLSDETTDSQLEKSVCGNGVVEEGETCDDGNTVPADGCSGVCKLEPGYECPQQGKSCVRTSMCGNGALEYGESCDDGNNSLGDGCDDKCAVENGWACDESGCTEVEKSVCGDGLVGVGEQCDDGGDPPESGDGCDATCQVEEGWQCPKAGQACEPLTTEFCGNGAVEEGETCDDANVVPGDGCSAVCAVEVGYTCDDQGCEVACGDGLVIGAEACDDGNTQSGDGCAGDCSQMEDGYVCPVSGGVGGACILKDPGAVCPNGVLEFGEQCDDGNAAPGDGCTNCIVDDGYRCPAPNQPCEILPFCGDGYVDFLIGEECDDGNALSTDGCDGDCQIMADFICPTPKVEGDRLLGGACRPVVCGDGVIEGAEQCDDNNKKNGDGCSKKCQLEPGWTCPANLDCQARECGDGILAGDEQCDDGNKKSGDGCSDACRLEEGWACSPPGAKCHETVCNDGIKEGLEPCDDGNDVIGDGCTPYCEVEPDCSQGACVSTCGDGLMLPNDNEECDDGNTKSGDGCSADCRIETGFECPMTVDELPNVLKVPVTLRDVIALPTGGGVRHPDFQSYCCGVYKGLVENELGADGKPNYSGAYQGTMMTNSQTFDQWYIDTPGVNLKKTIQFSLAKQASGSYYLAQSAYFPWDGDGFVAAGLESQYGGHNFGFTSEMRYWFEFKGDESLSFTGDDDVWVFIGGQLVVDIGGVHGATSASVTLNSAKAAELGLEKGKVYEIVLFHAERHTSASNFNLTLAGFVGAASRCASVCGDGVKASDEQCDFGDTCGDGSTCKDGHCNDGSRCNDGSYGGCTKGPDSQTGCKLAPYCGDGIKNGSEQCDDGFNNAVYSPAPDSACATGCGFAPYCGDGKVDAGIEECDGGETCEADCTFKPRCGDGALDAGEQCDDGASNGTPGSTCDVACRLKCGNGQIDAGEQCDPGEDGFTSAYGGCLPAVGDQKGCVFGPRCGDGVKNGPEECDDGLNDGSYGACAPGCVLSPRCGDGEVQASAGEQCDEGASNVASGYVADGEGLCTSVCKPVRYCGDGTVTDGEGCDDGVNSGVPGSCEIDCSAWIELPSCGDGKLDEGEECDAGAQNGTLESNCDTTCRVRCGNGVRDSGEECDDGVNDGSYGTCSPECKLADYCGDGELSGTEQCDEGADNKVDPYGEGLCDVTCRKAPYCGDGRISEGFGEECDGQSGCTEECRWSVVR